MLKLHKNNFGVFFSLLLMLIVSSCGKENKAVEETQEYNVVSLRPPAGYDPTKNDGPNVIQAINLVFSTLVRLDASGEIVPHVAQEWSISDDGKTYKFKIRPNIKFQNNDVLAADDIVFSFVRIFDRASIYKDYSRFFSTDKKGKINAIYKQDDQTVVICLNQKFEPFLKMLTTSAFSIVPKKEVIGNKDFFLRPWGSGAYSIHEQLENKIVFKAFDDYFKGKPKIHTVNFITETSISNLKKKFLDGDIHQSPNIPFDREMLNNNQFKNVFVSEQRVYFLGFNLRKAPTDDINFRKAIKSLLNFNNIDAALKGYPNIQTTHNFIPKGMYGYSPEYEKINFYDEKKAYEYLKKSKVKPKGELSFSIKIPKPADQFIIDQVVEAFNKLNVKIRMDTEWKNLGLENTIDGPDVFFIGVAPNCPDPFFIFNYLYSGGKERQSFIGYKDAEFNKLLDEYVGTSDNVVRLGKIRKMNQKIIDDAILIPVYFGSQNPGLFKRNVRGIEFPYVDFAFPLIEKIWLE